MQDAKLERRDLTKKQRERKHRKQKLSQKQEERIELMLDEILSYDIQECKI